MNRQREIRKPEYRLPEGVFRAWVTKTKDGKRLAKAVAPDWDRASRWAHPAAAPFFERLLVHCEEYTLRVLQLLEAGSSPEFAQERVHSALAKRVGEIRRSADALVRWGTAVRIVAEATPDPSPTETDSEKAAVEAAVELQVTGESDDMTVLAREIAQAAQPDLSAAALIAGTDWDRATTPAFTFELSTRPGSWDSAVAVSVTVNAPKVTFAASGCSWTFPLSEVKEAIFEHELSWMDVTVDGDMVAFRISSIFPNGGNKWTRLAFADRDALSVWEGYGSASTLLEYLAGR